MDKLLKFGLGLAAAVLGMAAFAQSSSKVVDISTRTGVTERLLVVTPAAPKAAAILFAGGHGGLQIFPNGSFKWGDNNFLVRTRQLFADQGIIAVVVDTPSDRQSPPYLGGFRQSPEHVADVKAVVAWVREQAKVPVWLVGTSRGTQSAAFAATELNGADGPDGLVLTSSILRDEKSRPVTKLPLGKLAIPVLVVHHEEDGCSHCPYGEIGPLMDKLAKVPRAELIGVKAGSATGDPCEAMSYHGYNGIENEVVAKIANWMLAGK